MNLVITLAGISALLLLAAAPPALGQSLPGPVIEGRIGDTAPLSTSLEAGQVPVVDLHASRFVIVPSDAIRSHMPVITPPDGLVLAMPVIRPSESNASTTIVSLPLPKAPDPERQAPDRGSDF